MKRIMEFLKDEEGASMAEYALLLALITVALVTVIGPFRQAITGAFTNATRAINSGTP